MTCSDSANPGHNCSGEECSAFILYFFHIMLMIFLYFLNFFLTIWYIDHSLYGSSASFPHHHSLSTSCALCWEQKVEGIRACPAHEEWAVCGEGRESQVWALPLGSVTLGKKNLSVSESVFLTSSRRIIIPSYLIGFKKKPKKPSWLGCENKVREYMWKVL